MIVCVCKRVSDKEIKRRLDEGASFDDLQFELGVATQCGRCEEYVRELCNGYVPALQPTSR